MKLRDLTGQLSLNILQAQGDLDVSVSGGYTSDLLSDVMAYGKEKNVWITCQTHENIVAIAKLKNLAGIILVNSRKPDQATMQKAREENVVILGTSEPAFAVTGALYNLLKK
ncbi:MAG: serine kinase [Candidatus Aminicenantes bacterium]|jgi:hypothetical protein|nr:serine kinase [Candidatus Aminicenantes bacterium]